MTTENAREARARELIATEDYDEALLILDAIDGINSGIEHKLIGDALLGKDDFEEAAVHYRIADSLGQDGALYDAAMALWYAELFDEAISVFVLAWNRDRHTLSGETAAECLYFLRQIPEALRIAEEVSALGDDENSRRSAGIAGSIRFTYLKERGSRVEELLRRGSAVYSDAAADLGNLLWESGRKDEAEEVLREAVSNGHETAAIVLGNFLQDEKRDFRGAAEAYRAGIRMGDAYSAYNLGLLLSETLGDPKAGRRWIAYAAAHGDEKAKEHSSLKPRHNRQ